MIDSFRFSDLVSVFALMISAYAAWKTLSFQKRQKALIEVQERLSSLLVQKEEGQSAAERKADLSASIIKLGNSKYRLKVWNKGKAAAKNVSISFPQGNDIVDEREVADKFPLEYLDSHQSVELIAFVHMGTKRKHVVDLNWVDSSNNSNSKTVHLTI